MGEEGGDVDEELFLWEHAGGDESAGAGWSTHCLGGGGDQDDLVAWEGWEEVF